MTFSASLPFCWFRFREIVHYLFCFLSHQKIKSLNMSNQNPAASAPAKKILDAAGKDAEAGTSGQKKEGPFTLRIINTMNYKETKLKVTKEYTIDDVYKAYSPFESHPEFYTWKDMYGRPLDPNKTLVQNGIVGQDEVVEFEGIEKEPCILMVFKDGMEDEPLTPLNPNHRNSAVKNMMCRNY